jgi:hypothetical protein
MMALLAAPAQGQIIDLGGSTVIEGNQATLDRFGRPLVGLRAAREPEMRRLREMSGRNNYGKVNVQVAPIAGFDDDLLVDEPDQD